MDVRFCLFSFIYFAYEEKNRFNVGEMALDTNLPCTHRTRFVSLVPRVKFGQERDYVGGFG